MNPVDRPLLDIGLTRLEFLRISGKGLAGLTIAPALLSLLGCKQEDIDSGTVGLINTPKGVLVTQRARCTGCHRCEISCTNFNDGSVGTFFSRIKIHRNYFFGDNGVGSGGGLYGDLNYTADTCRQCKSRNARASARLVRLPGSRKKAVLPSIINVVLAVAPVLRHARG